MAATYSDDVSGEASDKDNNPLFNEKNPRFKFNGKKLKTSFFFKEWLIIISFRLVYPPEEKDLTSLRTPKGLISAPILDHYLSFALDYDESHFLIIPAHYSDMIESCDKEIIAEFPKLITSKYTLLPVHRK